MTPPVRCIQASFCSFLNDPFISKKIEKKAQT